MLPKTEIRIQLGFILTSHILVSLVSVGAAHSITDQNTKESFVKHPRQETPTLIYVSADDNDAHTLARTGQDERLAMLAPSLFIGSKRLAREAKFKDDDAQIKLHHAPLALAIPARYPFLGSKRFARGAKKDKDDVSYAVGLEDEQGVPYEEEEQIKTKKKMFVALDATLTLCSLVIIVCVFATSYVLRILCMT